MKVFSNLSNKEKNQSEFENEFAKFHASLLIEEINLLSFSDYNKKKILNKILNELLKN